MDSGKIRTPEVAGTTRGTAAAAAVAPERETKTRAASSAVPTHEEALDNLGDRASSSADGGAGQESEAATTSLGVRTRNQPCAKHCGTCRLCRKHQRSLAKNLSKQRNRTQRPAALAEAKTVRRGKRCRSPAVKSLGVEGEDTEDMVSQGAGAPSGGSGEAETEWRDRWAEFQRRVADCQRLAEQERRLMDQLHNLAKQRRTADKEQGRAAQRLAQYVEARGRVGGTTHETQPSAPDHTRSATGSVVREPRHPDVAKESGRLDLGEVSADVDPEDQSELGESKERATDTMDPGTHLDPVAAAQPKAHGAGAAMGDMACVAAAAPIRFRSAAQSSTIDVSDRRPGSFDWQSSSTKYGTCTTGTHITPAGVRQLSVSSMAGAGVTKICRPRVVPERDVLPYLSRPPTQSLTAFEELASGSFDVDTLDDSSWLGAEEGYMLSAADAAAAVAERRQAYKAAQARLARGAARSTVAMATGTPATVVAAKRGSGLVSRPFL